MFKTIPTIQEKLGKGSSLSVLLSDPAVEVLAHNLAVVAPAFDPASFIDEARRAIQPLALMDRGRALARVLRAHLPADYLSALDILLRSMGDLLIKPEGNGTAGFFYLPHGYFVAFHGVQAQDGAPDPFDASMHAQYLITQRFTSEFSMRYFLLHDEARALKTLMYWLDDPSPHVRRLCSEGSRPRLPWGLRIPSFVRDPAPCLPILEALKDDPSLYVRRSVANHLGDIAKDHLPLALSICERWLEGASADRRWVIRHALRYPAKKNDVQALALRKAAA